MISTNFIAEFLNIEDLFRSLLQKEIDKKDQEIETLLSLIKRLEKSNGVMGNKIRQYELEIRRLKGEIVPEGWDS
jgi:peptidoglycan hydrolase CwlO-like protein